MKVKNLISSFIFWLYTSNSFVARLLLEDMGAVGDVKQQFGASAAFTITLASLASSSTRTTGRESTAIAVSGIVVDYLVSGKITVGTSPTVSKIIDIWVYAAAEDDPIYPDVIDGTDSDETLTSENVRNAALRYGAGIVIDNVSDRTYWIRPFSIASLFGGVLPTHFGLFVAHDTGVNLNATAGNHAFYYTPVFLNVAQS